MYDVHVSNKTEIAVLNAEFFEEIGRGDITKLFTSIESSKIEYNELLNLLKNAPWVLTEWLKWKIDKSSNGNHLPESAAKYSSYHPSPHNEDNLAEAVADYITHTPPIYNENSIAKAAAEYIPKTPSLYNVLKQNPGLYTQFIDGIEKVLKEMFLELSRVNRQKNTPRKEKVAVQYYPFSNPETKNFSILKTNVDRIIE